MGESGLPADHRLTGGRSAQINGRPGRPVPLPHGKNRPPAARMGRIGGRRAGGGRGRRRVNPPGAAIAAARAPGVWRRRRWLPPPGAACAAAREPRAHGPGLAGGGQRRRSTREGAGRWPAPFANHSCWKGLLLQTGLARRRLAADCFWPSRPTFPLPFPQACGGRNGLISRVSALGAFPAGLWRQRSETFVGHRASGGPRLLTPVALGLSKQVAAYVRLSYIRVNLYV